MQMLITYGASVAILIDSIKRLEIQNADMLRSIYEEAIQRVKDGLKEAPLLLPFEETAVQQGAVLPRDMNPGQWGVFALSDKYSWHLLDIVDNEPAAIKRLAELVEQMSAVPAFSIEAAAAMGKEVGAALERAITKGFFKSGHFWDKGIASLLNDSSEKWLVTVESALESAAKIISDGLIKSGRIQKG